MPPATRLSLPPRANLPEWFQEWLRRKSFKTRSSDSCRHYSADTKGARSLCHSKGPQPLNVYSPFPIPRRYVVARGTTVITVAGTVLEVPV